MRKPGYYWVRQNISDDYWQIAKYYPKGYWMLNGEQCYDDSLYEIDNIIIDRPAPQSGDAEKYVNDKLGGEYTHSHLTLSKKELITWLTDFASRKVSVTDDVIKLLERASGLVGNPGTNISGSTDIACENWQKEYEAMRLKMGG